MKRCCFNLSMDTIKRIARLSCRPDGKKSGIVTQAVWLLDEVNRGASGGGRPAIVYGDGHTEILVGPWGFSDTRPAA